MLDIELAFKTIKEKRAYLDSLDRYANGPQPLKYSTERLREAFDDITAHVEINWLSVVIDATLDRLGVTGFDVQDNETANKKIDKLFARLHLDIEADAAHNAALSMTEGYIIAWKDAGGEIDLYYNDPRMCHVFYDPNKPKVKSFAAKWFRRDDGHHQITLYYTNRLEQYVSRGDKETVGRASDFAMDGDAQPNPYGVIPVFDLRCPGETVKVLSLQDAINKTFADMMVNGEFNTAPQRWLISQAEPGDLQSGAGKLWWIPAGEPGSQATLGQFEAAPVSPYLEKMDNLANAIAVITRTPKHYFMSTGANISGEALLAMEAPLVKKAKSRQRTFSATWQDVAKFLLQLDGEIVQAEDISVMWERAEALQPLTEAQTRQLAVNTGIPLVTVLKREGWTEAEIAQMLKDAVEEKKRNRATGQAVLDALRNEDAQSNNAVV